MSASRKEQAFRDGFASGLKNGDDVVSIHDGGGDSVRHGAVGE